MYFYHNCVVNISDAPVDLEEAEYAVVDKSSKGNKGINQLYGILLKVVLNTINLKTKTRLYGTADSMVACIHQLFQPVFATAVV
jgi:hypothetical protein